MIPLKIETLYGGGAVERLQEEIQRVIANICDPNTPAKKVRKIKLELVVKPNEQRNMAEVIVNTSSTLCPPEPLETSIYIGNDPRTGEVAAVGDHQRRGSQPESPSRCGSPHERENHPFP